MRSIHWALATIIATIACEGKGAERPTAESLLADYQKSVEKLARVRIEWDWSQKAPNGKATGREVQHTLLRDGPHWKFDHTIRRADSPGSKRRDQTLIGDEILQVQQSYGPNLEPGRLHLALIRKQCGSKAYLPMTRDCLVVFGCLNGDDGYPVWTVLRESGSLEMLPEPEIVDGAETYVLKSQGKYGEHKVWLDPANGGLPRRMEVHKHAGNLLDDEQLGSVVLAPGTKAKPRLPGMVPPRREYSYRIDKVQIEKKQDVFVVTSFEDIMTDVIVDGQKREFKNEFKAKVFDVNPADLPVNAFQFDIDVPDGTIVFVVGLGDERIDNRYEWADGKVRERVGQ